MGTDGLLVPRSGTEVVHTIEERRSRFVTTLARTDDPADARALVDRVRRAHPDARHHCSAFLVHEDGRNPVGHTSDDGEPAGTAGTPMLEAIRASGVWNVTAVVTRYFGGVLLGTGGLVRAYSTSVAQALAMVPLVRLCVLDLLEADLSPAGAGRVEADLRAAGARGVTVEWGPRVTLRVSADPVEARRWHARLAELTGGAAVFRVVGRTTVEVDAPDRTA